jgi:hypothetical protein
VHKKVRAKTRTFILCNVTSPYVQSFFEPDAQALCDYCQTLAQVLCQQSLLPDTEKR